MGIAAEYKAKVNNSGFPEKFQKARDNFWEYNKLINPKFFKDSRPHLKVIADTLQALFEYRIIKQPGDESWKFITMEEKKCWMKARRNILPAAIWQLTYHRDMERAIIFPSFAIGSLVGTGSRG